MILLHQESQFYPISIFKQLSGLSKHTQIERLHEVPHQTLVDLLRALKKESSLHFSTPLKARIEMVESVISNKYGNIFPPNESWKTWWVLQD